MRRVLTVLGAMVALFFLLPAAPGHADPYSPGVPTRCTVETPGAIEGKRVVLDVTVTANSAEQPRGTVELAVRGSATARAATWTKTVRYNGVPVRVVGPRLAPGSYTATMRFRPSGDLYAGCRDALAFTVGGSEVGSGAGGGPGASASGLLPNTGGPHLAFLVVGLGLVAAGGGVVARSRRTA